MAKVYLSPSNQFFNTYSSGFGNEGLYMNLLADIAVPYFTLNGIETGRRDRDMTVREAIAESNAYMPDLHIAIHSNASPEGSVGKNSGPEIYYFDGSSNGRTAAESIAEQLKNIYPDPDNVKVIPINDELAEIKSTVSPAVYIEVGYHDNKNDADWIVNNLDKIARAIVKGTLQYLDM